MPELLGKWYSKKPTMPSEVDAATSSTTQDNHRVVPRVKSCGAM